MTLTDPRVEQPSLRRIFLVPSAATARAGESAALDVLAQVLGTGSNSYLYRALVVDQKLAVGAGAWYWNTIARRHAVRRLGVAAAGRDLRADRGRARQGAGRFHRRRRQGGGSRTRQDAADLGSDLRAGQPDDAGALVRRRADHRAHHRRRARLAATYPRRHRQGRAGRREAVARQEAFGHRLSHQGTRCRRSARDHSRNAVGPRRRRSPALVGRDGLRHQYPARRLAGRHRGLAGAGKDRADAGDGIRLLVRRLDAGPRRQAGRRQLSP